MNWWAWVIGGAILLGAELGVVNAHFYFVLVGTAAIVVGMAKALIPSLAPWLQWGGFAVLAVLSMVFFRERLYERLHGPAPAMKIGPAGAVFTLPNALDPGHSCRAEHSGAFWTVRNETQNTIPAGARVRIARVDGLTLIVVPDT